MAATTAAVVSTPFSAKKLSKYGVQPTHKSVSLCGSVRTSSGNQSRRFCGSSACDCRTITDSIAPQRVCGGLPPSLRTCSRTRGISRLMVMPPPRRTIRRGESASL